MADARAFFRRMERIAATVEGNANKIVQRAAVAIETGLVTRTPVDTGRARSNWLASLGAPRTDVVEPSSVEATLANAQSIILRRPEQRAPAIYLTNNVPYIGRLNAGSSAQAPAGFVEAAVAEGAAIIKNAKLLGRF